jgi:hypothetical protein
MLAASTLAASTRTLLFSWQRSAASGWPPAPSSWMPTTTRLPTRKLRVGKKVDLFYGNLLEASEKDRKHLKYSEKYMAGTNL